MGRRFQARRGNGQFTRNTPENTMGLHIEVCPACNRLNAEPVGQLRPAACHACCAPLYEPGMPRDRFGGIIDPRDRIR
jgi:hypothetical protein